MEYSVSAQIKTTTESGICMLQMFVSILTAGWYRPVLTTITTFLVWCKCNRQHRWLDIAITNKYACRMQVYQTCLLVGTSLQNDMTVG